MKINCMIRVERGERVCEERMLPIKNIRTSPTYILKQKEGFTLIDSAQSQMFGRFTVPFPS
jgi:hypothetical protein